jgi:hypothetical protein
MLICDHWSMFFWTASPISPAALMYDHPEVCNVKFIKDRGYTWHKYGIMT